MLPDLNYSKLLSSESLLCVVLLVSLVFISLKVLPSHISSLRHVSKQDAAIHKAAHAFSQYDRSSNAQLSQMRSAYSQGLRFNSNQKKLATHIGYPEKLDRLRQTIQTNSIVTTAISQLAKVPEDSPLLYDVGAGDFGRVREALKHFVRDWSAEGQRERDKIFRPILDILTSLEINPLERVHRTVLIPGSGLGRLAYEISQLGFDTTANERSAFMNLAFRFILSTTKINEHKVEPFAQWWSHQRKNDSLFRSVEFPDTIPRLSPMFNLNQGDFFDVVPPNTSAGYSYIVSLFFIDTSLNIIKTIQHIYSLLAPGGVWINLGPLLWNSSGAALELSLEEVLQLVDEVGFQLVPLSEFTKDSEDSGLSKTIDCEYTSDQSAMMQWVYKAELWVARKPKW